MKYLLFIISFILFYSCGSSKKITQEHKVNDIEKIIEKQDSTISKTVEKKEENTKEKKTVITKITVYDTSSKVDSTNAKGRVLSETVTEEIYEKDSNIKEDNNNKTESVSKEKQKEKDNSIIDTSQKEESNNPSFLTQLYKLIIAICILFVIYIAYRVLKFFKK